MPLCRLVARQPEPLWNNSWLKKKIATDLPTDSIVNREVLKEMGQVISFNERISYDEIAAYGESYPGNYSAEDKFCRKISRRGAESSLSSVRKN